MVVRPGMNPSTRIHAHGIPDPADPDLPPPQPSPVPDDVPPPAHAPVQEPDAPEPPVKA
jgi:hypothetical protein